MLALIAAFLIALAAFGVGDNNPDLFLIGLACWALHFALAIPLPWPHRS